MKKSLSTSDKTQAYELEIDHIENFQTYEKPVQIQLEEGPTPKKDESFNSMEKFCYQFRLDFFDKVNQTLTIQELTEKYEVKNRRVYDLLGILEGFSFICKIKKKGTYMWIGVNESHYAYQFEEKKSVSLKDIAGLLKLLLNNFRQGLTIKQLNQKIIYKIQQKTKRQQCKLTITRRIYECLKVMKVFGMVQKQDNLFKSTPYKIGTPILQFDNRAPQKERITKGQKKILRRVIQKVGAQRLENIIIHLFKDQNKFQHKDLVS